MEKETFRVGKYTPLLPGRKNKRRKKILRGSFYLLTLSLSVIAALSSLSVALRVPVKYTTYERIGRFQCPYTPGTTTTYQGVTVSYSYNNGAPTSYSGFRCMPLYDDIDYYNGPGYPPGYPLMDQVYSENITKYKTFMPSDNYDAACAVCMVEGRGSIVVIPGKIDCLDSSWTYEYRGYLMTGNTCVDIEMEIINAQGDPDGVAFLRHEVISSKVNPKYQDNNVLNCVVCSK